MKLRIISILALILTSTCAFAGFFSGPDPVNNPTDRFPEKPMESGVPLSAEYIIHGGDVGSMFDSRFNRADEIVNHKTITTYWIEYQFAPKLLVFYLKRENGKWTPVNKEDAIGSLKSGMDIERLAFLYAPKSQRELAKSRVLNRGRYDPSCVHNQNQSQRSQSLGIFRNMNCYFEDNLVSLYTNRGCIATDDRFNNNKAAEEKFNFTYTECRCPEVLTDRENYGYSFCTSNFNKGGRIDVEGIRSALAQAGGLKNILKISTGVDFESPEQFWPIAEEKRKAEEMAQFEAAQAIKQKAIVEEAKNQDAKYQILKDKVAKATSKADIEDVLANVSQVVDWRLEKGVVPSDPDELKPKLKAKLNEFAAVEERQAKLKLANWRKGLHEGDGTNCGMVIETKKGLVKIQMSASGKERWIKQSELLPAGEACPVEDAADVAASGGSSSIDKINGILSSGIRESASFNGEGSKEWVRNARAAVSSCELTFQQDIGFTFDHSAGRPLSWAHKTYTMPLREAFATSMAKRGYNGEARYGEINVYCSGGVNCLIAENGKQYDRLTISNLQTENSADTIRDEINKIIKKCGK